MKKIIIAAALMVACINANAEGVYLGLGFGEAKTPLADLGLGPTVKEDETGDSNKYFVGYDINESMAVEATFQHFDGATISVGSTDIAHIKGTAVILDGIAKFQIMENMTVFAKLGVAQTKVEAWINTVGNYYADREFNPHFGLGAQYDFSENFGVRAELERTLNVGDSYTGEADIDYVGLGLFVHF